MELVVVYSLKLVPLISLSDFGTMSGNLHFYQCKKCPQLPSFQLELIIIVKSSIIYKNSSGHKNTDTENK